MGACREAFDLTNKHGRRNFWRHLRRGRFNKLVWGDTFPQFWCRVVGHVIYDPDNGHSHPIEWACRRCHHFIKR